MCGRLSPVLCGRESLAKLLHCAEERGKWDEDGVKEEEAVKAEGVVKDADRAEWAVVKLLAQVETAYVQIAGTRFPTALVNPAMP